MTRAVRNVLHGPLPEKWNSLSDASHVWRKLPYALLLASLFVFGVWPKLLTDKINPDAEKIVAGYKLPDFQLDASGSGFNRQSSIGNRK